MIQTDAFFTLGRQHHVCQDYAMSTHSAVYLSDGCSSSPHTDFGSRFLCRMAQQHGLREAVSYSRPLLGSLGLPKEALDATLLVAESLKSSVVVKVCGDGVIVARRRDGSLVTVEVSYPSGAPLYPNYGTDAPRLKQYVEKFGTKRVVQTCGLEDPEQVLTVSEDLLESVLSFDPNSELPWGWKSFEYAMGFSHEMFDLVLIFSDGILSFRKPGSHPGLTDPVLLQDIALEMTSIKSYAGEFINRRAKRFLKDASAKGWIHDDDFSVAGIYLGSWEDTSA